MQDFAAHSIGHIAPHTILYDGRYRIDLLLAESPTRAVYRAWDLSQQRPATILELATPDATTAAAALQHAAPLVQLNHDALTPIQVIFAEKGTLFLALALAGGQTIERIMAERANPITAAAAVRWIAQAAEGVEFLDHELPTWHLGDLSPAALLVTAEDRVQLLGFEVPLGLLTPPTLAAALPVGAVAPELASDQCDARSDVYGLAATLYYLLTRQRWSPQRESLANARADLSRALIATIMRGLAEQPDARWPDAATFYQELLRSLPMNHPAQRGAPWWDEDQASVDELAEEPPTLITTRDQLRAAVAAQQAALGIAAAPTPDATETNAPSAASDTLILSSPEVTHVEEAEVAMGAAESLPPTDEPAPSLQTVDVSAPSLPEYMDAAARAHDAAVVEQPDVGRVPPETALTPEPDSAPSAAEPETAPIAAVMPAAANDAAEANDAVAQPEPVAATILRPRWPWSDAPEGIRAEDESTPPSAGDEAAPPSVESGTGDGPTTATPTMPREQTETIAADTDGAASQDALPEPAFADTLVRWPDLLTPEPVASNGTLDAAATRDQVGTVEANSVGADDQGQTDAGDFTDITALPTQIKVPPPARNEVETPDIMPAPTSAYALWDAAPTQDIANAAATAKEEDAAAPHLALDADIVAAAADVPIIATPPQEEAEPDRVADADPTPPVAATPAIPEADQIIVAHSDYLSSEPPPTNPPKTSKTPSRPLGSGLLDKLRTILHTPGQMPALATGTVVVPRHMYPQHTYSILVRLQCRPTAAATSEPPKKEATFVIVEVEAAADAFYVPVRRLALRLPNEGGLSEGTFTITALRPSPQNETDPITFTFRSVDNQLLHEGQFLAEISILAPQQLAGGNPMLTLVHALDIEQTLA